MKEGRCRSIVWILLMIGIAIGVNFYLSQRNVEKETPTLSPSRSPSLSSPSSTPLQEDKRRETTTERTKETKEELKLEERGKAKEKSKGEEVKGDEKFKGIPTYEEYIEMAKKKRWSPVDPIDKLLENSRRYSQVFDIKNFSKTNELLKMLNSEAQFLFSVLMKSSHLQIDLTDLFFDSIEGIHRGLYHVEKQILQTQQERVVTRAEAEYYSKQFLYGFSTAVLRITMQKDNSKPLYPHISIDLDRPIGREGLPALATAVSLRLHRLYLPLVEVGATLNSALLQAVINNDPLSISLLLNTSLPQLFSPLSKMHSLPTEIYVACASHLLPRDTIERMALVFKQLFPDSTGNVQDFCSFDEKNEKKQVDKRVREPRPSGEYLDLGLKYSIRSSEIVPECDVDVIRIQSENEPEQPQQNERVITMKVEEYLRHYVQKKKPVVITGLIPSDPSGWSMSALKKVGKSLTVSPQSIPYQDQLLSTEASRVSATLTSYLKEMREYSEQLQTWLTAMGDTAREESDIRSLSTLSRYGGVDPSYPLPPPSYVFDNKIMSPQDSVSKLLHFPFPSISDTQISTDISNKFDSLVQATFDFLHNSSFTTTSYVATRQFYVGPPLSGAPFHAHGPAYNALMFGRKLWFLLPPGSDLYSNLPPIRWASLMENTPLSEHEKYFPYPLPSLGMDVEEFDTVNPPQLCHYVQHAGDVMFVPSLYTHQVLNLAESVGFATELHYQGREITKDQKLEKKKDRKQKKGR